MTENTREAFEAWWNSVGEESVAGSFKSALVYQDTKAYMLKAWQASRKQALEEAAQYTAACSPALAEHLRSLKDS
jgi:hypothetical protein